MGALLKKVLSSGGDIMDAASAVKAKLAEKAGATDEVTKVAKKKAGERGNKGLLSVREAVEDADRKIAEAKASGGPAIVVKDSHKDLKVLPKTESPYIETEQFLPARQNPRMKEGKPVYNERTTALLNSRKAKKELDKNIDRGDAMGMREWYGTAPLYEAAMQEGLSHDDFLRMMQHLASASQRSPVPDQIKRGSATWVADRQGLLTPDAPDFQFAPGYGSLAQKDIIKRAYEIAAGEGLDESKKLGRFYQNLVGNLEPGTIDVMAMRGPILSMKDPRWLATDVREKIAGTKDEYRSLRPREMYDAGELSMKQALDRPGFWEAAPKGAEYGAFEDLYRDAAQRRGIKTAEAQASAWYGTGADAGLRTAPRTFMQAVEDRVMNTAQKRQESPQSVLSAFLRGEKPLMGVGAGVGVGANQEPTWETQ